MLAGKADLETLGDAPGVQYELPASDSVVFTNVGIPLDEVEDLLPESAAYRQASRVLLPRQRDVRGRPLTPLHGGHVGLLCTAGMLNGVFGEGDDRHIAHGRLSGNHPSARPAWDGLTQDRHMSDFHLFMHDLIWLRRHHPALRSEPVNVFHSDEYNRILAFHRWVPDVGRDVVVVVSLREQTFQNRGYNLGFPLPGAWYEVFNSDAYDLFPNPWTQGNGGGISADGPPMDGLRCSAGITIPANGVLILARDRGD
jgi:alpha amylase-like protein